MLKMLADSKAAAASSGAAPAAAAAVAHKLSGKKLLTAGIFIIAFVLLATHRGAIGGGAQ